MKLLRNTIHVILILLSISCTTQKEEKIKVCPRIFIAENSSYSKIVQHMDTYQISIDGYHSDCINVNSVQDTIAVIQPIFRLRRLDAGNEVNVPFEYYIQTAYGTQREYLIATFPEFKKEILYSGAPVKISIPYKLRYDTAINIGLIVNPQEQIYNNRYFNEKFDYSEE